ncbi:MAG: hypothetical protein A2096_06685 [Spirochaetes bacterium GWF1_41_5]|nr:MAG: hypothetical protein A2096_06685 [Spirochaetes bacterium GWF1_41_5]HBE01058.1 hypothetical protein [Spirochaetia bacterium]
MNIAGFTFVSYQFWAICALLLAIFELFSPATVFIWFAAGAAITALLSFLGIADVKWQLLFFSLSSLSLVGLWQFYLKKLSFFRKNNNIDERDPTLANLYGKALSAIGPDKPGEIELYENFHGLKKWQAVSEDTVASGAEIIVLESKGIKLVVSEKNKKMEKKP